jgi:lipid-A-disaccharide synthase-like uncharacterized protein
MWNTFLEWLGSHSTTEILWVVLGFAAQAMFTMRFVVQWIASERVKRSVMPVTFWYFSLLGGAMLLAYAIYRVDPVFIFGQAGGLIIYIRNIHLIWTHHRDGAAADEVRS